MYSIHTEQFGVSITKCYHKIPNNIFTKCQKNMPDHLVKYHLIYELRTNISFLAMPNSIFSYQIK